MLYSLVLIASLALSASATTVRYNLTVGNQVVSPDGGSPGRSAVLAGLTPATLQYPAPVLTATKGDVLKITVTNNLTDPNMRRVTSIAFDGILNNALPQYHGTSFEQQCPISPNGTFTYTVNTTTQAGTFLYRSGLSVQYMDGLRGALIVYDPEDPLADLYDIDDETTIFQLGEWYHRLSPDILSEFQITGSQPIYDSGLINGVGRINGGPEVPFPVLTVVLGKRYRLRLISNSPRSVVTFSVDDHNLTVIEADGIETEPVPDVESVVLYPGQRYSAVLNANQTVGNYWIRAPPSGGNQTRNPNLNATFTKAILRYVGAPDDEPTTLAPVPLTNLTDINLVPLDNPGSPGGDVTPDFSFLMNFTTGATATNPNDTWRINDIAYTYPEVPSLVQILQGNDTLPVSSNVQQVTPGALVELVMPLGDDGGGHPIHIQGIVYDIVQPGVTNVTNFVNPLRRDTFPILGDTTIVRFRVPEVFGYNHLHCHIVLHAEIGLQMNFMTPPDTIRANVQPDAEWQNLCAAYDALPPEFK